MSNSFDLTLWEIQQDPEKWYNENHKRITTEHKLLIERRNKEKRQRYLLAKRLNNRSISIKSLPKDLVRTMILEHEVSKLIRKG